MTALVCFRGSETSPLVGERVVETAASNLMKRYEKALHLRRLPRS